MNIGLDFDGVVVDSHRLKTTLLREKFQSRIRIEACRGNIQRQCGAEAYDQYLHVQELVYEKEEYHGRLEFMPGAQRRIKQLTERGHCIVIISSRSTHAARLAKTWLVRRGVTSYFVPTGSSKSKEVAARQFGLDYFVDDDLGKLKKLVGTVPNLHLFRQAHNAHITNAGPHIDIVKSWAEIGRSLSGYTVKR